MADAKIVRVPASGVAGTSEIDDNLDGSVLIESADGKDYIEIDTTDGSEKLILAAGGANVGVGASPAHLLHVQDGDLGIVTNNADNATAQSLVFKRSKSNTDGTAAVVADNDELGTIEFFGAEDGDSYALGAKIIARVNGTPGDGDMPTELVFAVSPDGSETPTERLVLSESGALTNAGAIGSGDGNASKPGHNFRDLSNTGMFHIPTGNIGFSANGSEKMRITSGGKVGIGEDSPLGADGGSMHIKTGDSTEGSVHANADELVIEGSSNSGITVLSGNSNSTTAHGALLFGRKDLNEAGGIRYRHGATGVNNYLTLRAAGEDKAFVDRDGQFGIIGAGAVSATAMIMARGNLKTQLTGHLDSSSSGTSLVGDNTDFKTQLQRGSAVKISTSAGNETFTVESVTSDTVAVLDSAISGTPVDGSNILGDGTLLAAETGDQKQCFAIKPNGGIAVGFARDGDSNEFNNNILLINPDGFTDVGNCSKNVIIGYDPGPSELLKVTDSVIMGYKAGGKGNNYNINNSVVIGNETADSSSGAHESCVVIGKEAGINHATDGIAIGRDSNFTAGSTNEIAIGDAATGHGSHTAVIGNSSLTQIDPGSDRGCNLGQVSFEFDAVHCVSVTEVSDERLKEQIEDTTLGVDFIKRLRPVSYKFKDRAAEYETATQTVVDESGEEVEESVQILKQPALTHTRKHQGLIAQEVKQVLDDIGMDSSEFGGYVDGNISGNGDRYALRYQQFSSPLIKAVQELTARIEELENGN